MWPINVLLHHVAGLICIHVGSVLFRYCLLKDVVHILGEENSLALTQTIRLANVSRPLAQVVVETANPVISQVVRLIWQHPCLWEEVVLFGALLVHAHQIAGQIIFSTNLLDSCVLINLLPRIKFANKVCSHAQVMPGQVIDLR